MTMKKLFNAAASTVREVFTFDVATTRHLEQVEVDVRRTARHWGM